MTRKEMTYERDLYFSQWIRNKLPDSSTGYSASDIDFVIWNWKTKRLMLLEHKTRNSVCRKGQHYMFLNLHKWIAKGIDEEWIYCGFHLIQFENTSFDDGKCFLNYKEITENELINFLSLE